MTRREFISTAALAGAGAMGGCASLSAKPEPDFLWADLVHLGINSWSDGPLDSWGGRTDFFRDLRQPQPYMRTVEKEWKFCVDGMINAGANAIVIDMAEGIQYESHPELAVKGSWSIERFRKELVRIRAMGAEPIPKMNFSASHDSWLKDYHRMVSSPKYYSVCADLIKEVCEIFDHPRFFHLGYDEEDTANQAKYQFAVVRQGELWWHDFLWFVKQTEQNGARAWIWSDYMWHHKDLFLKRMPKTVLQSNWYYGPEFDLSKIKDEMTKTRIRCYEWMDQAGYDQVPCGSNCRERGTVENLTHTVVACQKLISPERLKGFLMAPWTRQVPDYHAQNERAIAAMAAARKLCAR